MCAQRLKKISCVRLVPHLIVVFYLSFFPSVLPSSLFFFYPLFHHSFYLSFCVDMESTTAGTHVNSRWTLGVLSVEEIRVSHACAVVNVKTGGMFLRITQKGESVQLLSDACRAVMR